MKKALVVLFIVAAVLAPHVARAQSPASPLAQNAALRYWMAFAYMQNPPADQATADLLEQVASGKAPWDEARLGGILDANADALGILQRGAALPLCDWGLEYELGSSTPIAYIARARVLGRLNTLQGIRVLSRGEAGQAVDVWLAGLRFSQHVAANGTLVSALVGGVLMEQTLDALGRLGGDRRLDAEHRVKAAAVIRALPDGGMDWDGAWNREEALVNAERAKHPGVPHEMAQRSRVDSRQQQLAAARQRALDALTK